MRKRVISVICLVFLIFLAAVHVDTVIAGDAETAVIGKCAAASGGQPALFFICAVKDLSLTELKKCLQGECYGPNNTIVQWSDFINRTLFGTGCGGFHTPAEKKPTIVVVNNSNIPVGITMESEVTSGQVVVEPGYRATWELDFCDRWANIGGADGNFGWAIGSVIEIAEGSDGKVHQYSMTR